jgi:hypothetical protein
MISRFRWMTGKSRLLDMAAERGYGKTEAPRGVELAEEAKAERDYKGGALISFSS